MFFPIGKQFYFISFYLESVIFSPAKSIIEVFPEFCLVCVYLVATTMSAIPQGVFAAKRVRQNEEKLKNLHVDRNLDLSATHYNSKFMNSIWGMYNRYSVHNLKKNFDCVTKSTGSGQQFEVATGNGSFDKSADFKGSLSVSTTNVWSFS